MFQKDWGKHPFEVFLHFDETPIAAGSLAQVYRAVTKKGEVVAVKVQYPELIDTLYADLHSVDIIYAIVKRVFPKFQFGWLVGEFHDVLPKELDFINEARNSEQTAKNFANKPSLYIPKVHWVKFFSKFEETIY